MTTVKLLTALCITTCVYAQTPTPAPKKDPFAGFGSSLDKRAGPARPAAPPATAPMTATAASPGAGQQSSTGNMAVANGPSTGGIVLGKETQDQLSESSGGQTGKIDDLEVLLKPYGKAQDDTGAHPEVTIYEGQTMDGAPTRSCRIGYLAPLAEAEKVLFKSVGIVSRKDGVIPGFPKPLMLHTYDVKAGIYNRLTIVTDKSPKQQVVSLAFKAESINWHPGPPFVKSLRDWHTYDYVGTANRGVPGMVIDARIKDMRESGHYIVANTSFNDGPPEFDRRRPNDTTTWYVPEPLINMILDRIAKQSRK